MNKLVHYGNSIFVLFGINFNDNFVKLIAFLQRHFSYSGWTLCYESACESR